MKLKFGLRGKFIIIFIIASLIITVAIQQFTTSSFEANIEKKYQENAIGVAKLAASYIDGDQIEKLHNILKKNNYDFEDEDVQNYVNTIMDDHSRVQESLNTIKYETNTYYLYVILPYDEVDGIYIYDVELTDSEKQLQIDKALEAGLEITKDDLVAGVFGEDVAFEGLFPGAFEAMRTGQANNKFDVTISDQGAGEIALASTYAPIFNRKEQAVAFVGVDVTTSEISETVSEATVELIGMIVGIVLICMLVIILVIQRSVISPIKLLRDAAERISNGIYGEQVEIKSNDEISEISEVFNRMSRSIEGQVNEIQVINYAYYKYVPSQIFELLNRDNVIDVELGDQINVDLTVLDFNVVGFKKNVEKMTSKAIFAYINRILTGALPFILESDGVVETFQEAGFSAFFSSDNTRSLESAISICQHVNKMNKDQEAIEISFGLAFGSVMLGIVGHSDRLSTVSLSEQTRVSEYLQRIAPKYSSRIIITDKVALKIEDFDKRYHARFLGFLYNKATDKYEKLYDVFDGDEENMLSQKLATRKTFEEGVSLYCSKKYYEARVAFVKVLKANREDNAAREYLYLCNQYFSMEDVDHVDICIESV